ncbi:MAG TPA: hypothetical protein VFE78_05975, partial [Gemmataceae bacterium]|nr:hypothetical protein [Gemmataceae bacterium]
MFTNARRWFQRSSPRPSRPAPRRPRRLGVELLEDRLVPAVIDVLGVADNNNAVLTAGHAGTAADPFLAPSLRSAISFANTNPGGNTINLTAGGTYKTTLAGTAGETDNLAGEFAILPGGGDLTIQNTSGFAVAIDGNHLNRVFDINPNFNPASPTAKFTVTLSGLTIRNGFATDPNNLDGPSASGGGVRDVGNASLTLNNDVIANNAATADGGGVAMENTVSVPWTLTVNASVISGNHAGDAGGGIDTDGSGKVFINAGTVITGNSCVNQGGGVWLDAIQVGTVFQTATLSVTGATVSNNYAGGQGGGIGNAGNGAVTIAHSTLSGNTSLMTGGGFGDENAQDTLAVTNSLFVSNSASIFGGGVSVAGPSATVSNSTFHDNLAPSGGGVFADAGTALSLVGDLFAQNTGVMGGGGVSANGPTTNISNSEFLDNFAGTGGGLLVGGTTFTGLGLTFADNTSTGNGGAIELQSAGAGATQSFLTNSTLTGNKALNANGGTRGGAIDMSLTTSGDLVLVNDTLNGNFANTGGGLFWAGRTKGSAIFENT